MSEVFVGGEVDWRWNNSGDGDDVEDWDDVPLDDDWEGELSDELPEEIVEAITWWLEGSQSETEHYEPGPMEVWIAAMVEGVVARKWKVVFTLEYEPNYSASRPTLLS